MQVGNSEIDEALLIAEFGELIAEKVPDSLSSWELIGADAVISLLQSDVKHIKKGRVSHVPALSPEATIVSAWIPLILGSINTIFQIVKEKKLIEKANVAPVDADADKLAAVEQIVRNELQLAGLSKLETIGVSHRLAKTIVLVLK